MVKFRKREMCYNTFLRVLRDDQSNSLSREVTLASILHVQVQKQTTDLYATSNRMKVELLL